MKTAVRKLSLSLIAMLFVGSLSVLFAPTSHAASFSFGFSQGYNNVYQGNSGFYFGGSDNHYDEGYAQSPGWAGEWRWAGTRRSYYGCRVIESRRYCRENGWGQRECYVEQGNGWRC